MSSRSRVLLSMVALGALGFAVYSTAFSQINNGAVPARALVQEKAAKKEAPNVQKDPKDVKETARAKGEKDLELAAKLIHYGRKNKNAESLLLAAQIIHKTPTEELKMTLEKGQPAQAPAKTMDNSPKALLTEARKMSSAPAVEALATATEKILEEATRGTVGLPFKTIFNLGPNQLFTSRPIEFFGGEKAVVFVDMNGVYGRLILEVSDQYGNVVARDSLPGTYYTCSWVPLFTGTYRIRLLNIDTITFNCLVVTN